MPAGAPVNSVIASSLISTRHGRQRREERKIQKVDLKQARRYGMQEDAGDHESPGVQKFTHTGIVFVYDPSSNTEITSYPSNDYSSPTSGTQHTRPVMLSPKRILDEKHKSDYDTLRRQIIQSKDKWTSHTVMVVDMSGSMRQDDVNGARCRSDGVFLCLARDFVKKQLDAKQACETDLVSVILMQRTAQAVMIAHPMHWKLYNDFVGMREWKNHRPQGPGNYMPALELAEKLLQLNNTSSNSGSCSLSLLFCSDGQPSDSGDFAKTMGNIASQFGRRLTVSCMAIAGDGNATGNNEEEQDFLHLRQMAEAAQNYGSDASFCKPTLNTHSLSKIVTSLVTSLAASKTELTSIEGTPRSVRLDIRREHKQTPEDDKPTPQNWNVFSDASPNYVPYIWTWSYELDDFVTLMDPRCIGCYRKIANDQMEIVAPNWGVKCPQCKSCFVCWYCQRDTDMEGHPKKNHLQHHLQNQCSECARDRRLGKIVPWAVPSFSLAIKRWVFDEGAERIVYKVRFIDEHSNFIGPKMVAKESRFVEAFGSYEDRMNYHRDFLRTQCIASELANKFNTALDSLNKHFPKDASSMKEIPRIRFLKPLVVEAFTNSKATDKEWNILIEEQLEGNYIKFNSNKGYVHPGAFKNQNLDSLPPCQNGNNGLDIIEEESEGENYGNDSDDVFDSNHKSHPKTNASQHFRVRKEHIPQAFSHFTYEKSKKMLMVVDLQGVLVEHSDGTKEYVLTDPAIHKRRKHKHSNNILEGWTFGRTDRGESGMNNFFRTHHCNDACRILGLEEYIKSRR